MTRKLALTALCSLLLLTVLPTLAQEGGEALAPPEIPGVAVYIPFPVDITLDGDLADWAGVTPIVVDRGTMLSDDPAENGSFTFALAADAETLYLYMTMPDRNIITGQHGTNFWNEDSLEFYLNLSGDLTRTSYGEGVFQVNINPGDIGNTDPAAITVTGTNAGQSGAQAFVFATEDGWGFEAAVSLAERGVTPEHGLEIGFQAHANGASEQNRDVKLIWSLADVNDQSWQNPSLFGRGIFFEVGQTEIPLPADLPAAAAEPAAPEEWVSVNQTGYLPAAPKRAVYADDTEGPLTWRLVDAATGEVWMIGRTRGNTFDAATGSVAHVADFSRFARPGTYVVVINGVESAPFEIGEDIYAPLRIDALRYFYLNRSGIELDAAYAGDWARPAGHLSDNNVTCFRGRDADRVNWPGCAYTLDVSGGWYDAGDYGKYVVNGGISVWTLLNMYERAPEAFADGDLNIPESGNGVPDVLDEARWELEFLLAMQVPQGEELAGMVHHKIHDVTWAGMPLLPPTQYDNRTANPNAYAGRYLYPPSTAATLNLAATAAQCARIWREIDADFADRCLIAAETAWQAAIDHPDLLAGHTPGQGGGDYTDANVEDEFFWAAAELFITTGDVAYRDYLAASLYFGAFPGLEAGNVSAMYWGDTAALGTISLATQPNGLSSRQTTALQRQITRTADRYLETQAAQAYPVPLPVDGYYWGSNSSVLNNALLLALAYDFTGDVRYLNGAVGCMDYLLGLNGLGRSFVSGYGEVALEHPHHRFWANQPDNGFPPPPPGAVAGGPNSTPDDPAAQAANLAERPVALRYLDDIGSYTTNEVAINWNAPLAWLAAFLDERAGE